MFQQIGKCGWHLVRPATFDKKVQTLSLSKKIKKKSSDSANIVQDDTVMYSQDNLLHFAELYVDLS